MYFRVFFFNASSPLDQFAATFFQGKRRTLRRKTNNAFLARFLVHLFGAIFDNKTGENLKWLPKCPLHIFWELRMGGVLGRGVFKTVERAAFSSRGSLLLQGNSYLKSTLRLLLRRRVGGQICYLKNPLPKTPHKAKSGNLNLFLRSLPFFHCKIQGKEGEKRAKMRRKRFRLPDFAFHSIFPTFSSTPFFRILGGLPGMMFFVFSGFWGFVLCSRPAGSQT